MTHIEKANYDAQVLGGYTTGFMYDRIAAIDPLQAMEILWLDPRWWQALGKARGWDRADFPPALSKSPHPHTYAEYQCHLFVNHLWEKKDAESFFATLV